MRFTYTRDETAPATAGDHGPQPRRVVTEWYVDPLEIVAVGSLPDGVVLLCGGGHQICVDGTHAVIAEKVKIAKREAAALPGPVQETVENPLSELITARWRSQEPVPADALANRARQRPQSDEPDDGQSGDIAMMDMRDSPMFSEDQRP